MKICYRISGLPQTHEAAVIHAYWPAITKREVDVRPLLMYLRSLGKKIFLPVVEEDSLSPSMLWGLYESEKELKPNRWGILEPTPIEYFDPAQIDLVLVPALATDVRGNRLGYGGGYYDTFLSGLNVHTICGIFDCCVVDSLITEDHDLPVCHIVTESRIIYPGEYSL